jgi:hypothetical protein
MNVADPVLKDRQQYEAHVEDCDCRNRWSRVATTRPRTPRRVNDPDHTVKTRPGWRQAGSRRAGSPSGSYRLASPRSSFELGEGIVVFAIRSWLVLRIVEPDAHSIDRTVPQRCSRARRQPGRSGRPGRVPGSEKPRSREPHPRMTLEAVLPRAARSTARSELLEQQVHERYDMDRSRCRFSRALAHARKGGFTTSSRWLAASRVHAPTIEPDRFRDEVGGLILSREAAVLRHPNPCILGRPRRWLNRSDTKLQRATGVRNSGAQFLLRREN